MLAKPESEPNEALVVAAELVEHIHDHMDRADSFIQEFLKSNAWDCLTSEERITLRDWHQGVQQARTSLRNPNV